MELEKSVQLAEAIAAAVDVDDVHVVEQPVEDRRGEDFVGGEDLGPVADVLVGGQDNGALLISSAHETEEEVGLVSVERSEADFVDNEQNTVNSPW